MKLLRALAVCVGIIAVVMMAVAGPGTRFGLFGFRFGLSLLRYAAYVGIAAVIIAVVAWIATAVGRPPHAYGVLGVAVVLGAAAFLVPFGFLQKAKGTPPIHDITTDTQDPPQFVAVLPLRRDALNPAVYGGDSIAAQQHRAYPDIVPLDLNVKPEQAFDKALTAARAMGWRIDATDPATGRIEATATTSWFGFKDDVVVRVRPHDTGSRIDVRSVSRVGKGDLGTNASRVRSYLARIQKA